MFGVVNRFAIKVQEFADSWPVLSTLHISYTDHEKITRQPYTARLVFCNESCGRYHVLRAHRWRHHRTMQRPERSAVFRQLELRMASPVRRASAAGRWRQPGPEAARERHADHRLR